MTAIAMPLPLPDTASLLATAEARLRRQAAYARPLASRRGAGRALEAGFATATAALAEGMAPAALWRAVAAEPAGGAVRLGGEAVNAPRLTEAVAAGDPVLVWLCTLGDVGPAVAARLGEDYMLRHLAADLATQALFAAARAVHAGLAGLHPGRRLVRVPLRDAAGGRWDAGAVGRLLPLFGPAPLGVSLTDTGGMRPVNTLLGVMAARAA